MWISRLVVLLVTLPFVLCQSGSLSDDALPPTIVFGPHEGDFYRNGGSFTLRCKAYGVPEVTYKWLKNGIPLNFEQLNVIIDFDGTISIQPARFSDAGHYQCLASNKFGTALSTTSRMRMAVLGLGGGGQVFQRRAIEGQPFCIETMPILSDLPIKWTWENVSHPNDRNPKIIKLSKRIQMHEIGDLCFAYTKAEDDLRGRIYRIAGRIDRFNLTTSASYTNVTVDRVEGGPQPSPPRRGFTSLRQVLALEGQDITLRCFYNGNPEPDITWRRPGGTLPTGRYVIGAFNFSLTIKNVQPSDEGDYICYAQNIIESTQSNLNISVEAVPKFPTISDQPHDINVTEGKTITFRCYTYAKPNARVVWQRNGVALDPGNPPKRFSFSNNNRSLTIRDVCRDCDDRETKTDLMVIQCNASNVHGYAFGQGYLNVVHNKFSHCDYEFEKEHSIQWNRTLVGKEISQKCPGNTIGICWRECLLSIDGIAYWSLTNYNGCFGREFRVLLDKVYGSEMSSLTHQEIARQLSDVTNKSEGLSSGNLNASVMIINRLAFLRSGNTISLDKQEIKSIVQATSNVLQPKNFISWKQLEAVNRTVATGILFSADVYGRSLSTISKSEYSREQADYMVLEAWSLKKSNLPPQLEFPRHSIWDESSGDKISISLETLESGFSSEGQSTLNLWGSHYRTVNDYLPGSKYDDIVNSKVLSFSIDGLKPKEKLKRPVLITLQHKQEEGWRFRRTCAFWNFDRGDWDSDGCSVNSTNLTHTICSCDHLTNFAILMSRSPSYDTALDIISTIGCSISVVALILTIIVYAITWKQSKSAQATVLMNLCVALVVAYIIFMAGADKVNSKAGCTTVAVLLHYFFLAAFFLMLAEGVELLLYIIFVFHVRRTRETVSLIAAAWVLPLIIVVISIGSTKVEGYGSRHVCWLSVQNGLIWAFAAPVLCIVTVNFVILVIILRWRSKQRAFMANNAKKRDEIRATLWNLSVACPILGLGWLFGVISLSSSHVVFQYLFVILNSLQGLLIFIFHALFHNKKVHEKLTSLYSNCISRCRKSDSTQMTSAQDQPRKNKSEKGGFVPRAVKYYEQIGKQESSNSAETKLTSIVDSET